MTPEMLDSIIADLCNSPDLKFSQRYALQSLRKDRNDLQSQLAAASERARIAEAGHDAANAALRIMHRSRDAANERADGLQRIVDEARAQKPVCITTLDDFGTVVAYPPPNVLHSVPLYAAPVPAQPAVVPEDLADMVSKAMNKAWSLGQTYWIQADSESYSQNRKSAETQSKFRALVDATHAAILSTTDTEVKG